MCTSHPDFVRLFALATVSVGLVSCVSTQSPFLDAWIVNVSILPQLEFRSMSSSVLMSPLIVFAISASAITDENSTIE